MPRGSNPGERRGGRAAGTPNKRTLDLRERLAERLGDGWCPVVAMAEIAESKDAPLDLRLRALAEIAPYIHARRRPQAGPEDTTGLEALVASAVTISVTTGVTPPDPRPAASTDVVLESPASLTTPSPPPRPPLRLSLNDAGGSVLTDYDPHNRE